MKKIAVILLLTALCLTLCLGAYAEGVLPAVGDTVEGFVVKEISRLELVGADVTLYEHQKAGAQVMVLSNEDVNRTFSVSFRTPTPDDSGIPHVFEHATLCGSAKYPSKSLLLNLSAQTYNTYLNAHTSDISTQYFAASLSEAQLLKYADYFTDSMLHPMLMTDESIFRQEAWRYAMTDENSPLTIAGTVYSEMQGAYTLSSAATLNFYKTLFPGAAIGNSSGGVPARIPDMTWDHLKSYHDTYYHPSNSLTCLYGKIEDAPAFLRLLDGYFSAYDRKEFDDADAAYTPLSQAVEMTFEYGVEAHSTIENGSEIYYGVLCGDADQADVDALYLLTAIVNNAASDFQQTVKTELPSASVHFGIDYVGPEIALVFYAGGVDPEDAPTFRRIIDESFARSFQDGFRVDMVDAIASALKLNTLLSAEGGEVGVNLTSSIAYAWAGTGDAGLYAHLVGLMDDFEEHIEKNTYQKVIEKYILNNPRTALVVTKPVPGLKEKQDQSLREHLAEIKSGMTEEEIADIIRQTETLSAPKANDSAEYIKQLQAVTVDNLPEETRIFDIKDETDADGVRRMSAVADVADVGQTMLLLNAKGLPFDDLHWFQLYANLIGHVNTEHYESASLASLMSRYMHKLSVRSSLIDAGQDVCSPYLRCDWFAMDEDMQAGYDLLYDLLYNSVFTDIPSIASRVSQIKTALKQTVTTEPHNILAYRAFATANPAYAGFNYLNYLDYYAFLEKVEALIADDPAAVTAKLNGIQRFFHNRSDAVSCFAGSEKSIDNHRAIADGFLSRLDNEKRESVRYDFPPIADAEALVIDSAVQYNMVFASYEELGLSEYSGAFSAAMSLVNDAFLYPLLRDQYGAYGVLHGANEDGVYIVSYRDPNILETFAVYALLPELVAEYAVDQETLNGYILSNYTNYAKSVGELTGAMTTIMNVIEGLDQERKIKWMHELKSVTAEDIVEYAAIYRKLSDNGVILTAGGASIIHEHADLYDIVLNPFGEADRTQKAFEDVQEGAWYYDAVRYVYENDLMSAASDKSFGVAAPLTVGEIATAMYRMLGGSESPETCVTFFAGYGILPADAKADDVCTREQLASYLYTFCKEIGADVDTGLLPLPKLKDSGDISTGSEKFFRFVLTNQLMTLADNTSLAPQSPATRADLAYAFAALSR